VEELPAIFRLHRVDVLPGIFSHLPVGRKLAGGGVREVLDRDAVLAQSEAAGTREKADEGNEPRNDDWIPPRAHGHPRSVRPPLHHTPGMRR
jgi:hypothetical protein